MMYVGVVIAFSQGFSANPRRAGGIYHGGSLGRVRYANGVRRYRRLCPVYTWTYSSQPGQVANQRDPAPKWHDNDICQRHRTDRVADLVEGTDSSKLGEESSLTGVVPIFRLSGTAPPREYEHVRTWSPIPHKSIGCPIQAISLSRLWCCLS